MSRHLPARPNLEHLRNQAKDLLSDLRRRNPDGKLADAQHALARDYGFASWPRLKEHVESLTAESPFAGRWKADISKSTRPPLNQYQAATLEFALEGDTVTITDVVVNASGEEEHGTNTFRADGREYTSAHGYALTARWLGSRVLEAIVKKNGQQVSRVT